MPLIRAQVFLASADNLPENGVTNTYHFDGPNASPTELGAAAAALISLYSNLSPIFSDLLNGQQFIKLYDMSQPEPRAPVFEDGQVLVFSSGASMPPEVSICASFQAPKVSGQSQARRRGRVYLGPLRSTFLGTSGRPANTLAPTIATAFEGLLNYSQAAGITGLRWVVASSFGGNPVIDNGWIDNEFDTQRRRGRNSTTRTVFS